MVLRFALLTTPSNMASGHSAIWEIRAANLPIALIAPRFSTSFTGAAPALQLTPSSVTPPQQVRLLRAATDGEPRTGAGLSGNSLASAPKLVSAESSRTPERIRHQPVVKAYPDGYGARTFPARNTGT